MALNVGDRLGHYDVTALIGEGGMGQVYQATDTKLKRQVALKILPEAFSADPERLARFQREAEVLASLNHPNIAAIHGLEEADDVRALVLELVEGPTLADRIKQGPIPLDEALPIAKQIAEALEAAHEAGVIHRDLKPANIKVKDDGTVKVLDFGLAKAFQPDASDPSLSQSPTISLTAAATQMGMVIGTAAYMAPEQAKGLPVDKRADIWAFGAVLFEMLTGRKLFEAGDVSEMLASVLVKDPDISSMGNHVPDHIRSLVRRCLVKDSRQRLRDIGEVRLAMEGAFETTVNSAAATGAVPQLQVWQRPAVIAAALVATLVTGGVAGWSLMRPAPRSVTRALLTPPLSMPLDANFNVNVALTPDGTRVVYRGLLEGQPHLFVRPLAALEAAPLTGLSADPRNPFISPDGNWVGFFDGNRALQRVSISGGPPVTIVDSLGVGPRGASWGTDDTIIFATTAGLESGLLRVPMGGGELEVLTTPDTERGEGEHRWPEILPGGQAVLFTIFAPGSLQNGQIAVLSLESGEYDVLVPSGSNPRYVPTGHIVYGVGETLRAVGFDLDSLTVTSEPIPVVEDVRMGLRGAGNFAVAQDGSLAYVRGSSRSGGAAVTLAWVDRDGGEESLAAEPDLYFEPHLSPDGTRLAVKVEDDGGGWDIYIYDIARNNLTQLTFGDTPDCCPVWTPDGERVVFSSAREGTPTLYVKNADGTGEVERLTESDAGQIAYAWSGDGGPDPVSWTHFERRIRCPRWQRRSRPGGNAGSLMTTSRRVRCGSCSMRARRSGGSRGSLISPNQHCASGWSVPVPIGPRAGRG